MAGLSDGSMSNVCKPRVIGLGTAGLLPDSIPITVDCLHASLASVIRNFGTYRGPIPGTNTEPERRAAPSLRSLESANVSFHALKNLAGVRVMWTSSSCEHLELDLQTNVLKLFRHPSFCAMILLTSDWVLSRECTTSHLSQFFRDLVMVDDRDANVDSGQLVDMKYHREILLTFRIIFGQDKASMITRLGERRLKPGYMSWWYWWWRRRGTEDLFWNPPWDVPEEKDPLLSKLCGEDWRNVKVYEEIDAGPAKAAYAVDEEFPHFADRLMALQEFVKTQNPGDFWTLLKDRRDMNRLWTIRSAVLLGIGVAVLSVLQLLVGIAQLVVAIKDLEAGGDG
ncbi:hypothetical protein VTJ49DRAFT_2213 [Mycothermus thermophilus]|uniref:Uncharacterized protein n=1 Tax=Humicola insolens TaxID=85995 RepID=A0ABR3VAC4_HUMIN